MAADIFHPGDGDRLDRARVVQAASAHTEEQFLLGADTSNFSGHISATAGPNVNSVLSGDVVVGARSHRCYFKPIGGVSTSTAFAYGQASVVDLGLHEIVAWRLALALGSPWEEMVPPAVWNVPAGVGDVLDTGPLILGLPGIASLSPPGSGFDQLVSDAAFFDALIGAQDRHHENLRSDPAPPPLLGLLDHGYAFARRGDLHNPYPTAGFFIKIRRGERVMHRRGLAPMDYSPMGAMSMKLAAHERDAIHRLNADLIDLLGVAELLEDDRAQAMRDRIARMDQLDEILHEGAF